MTRQRNAPHSALEPTEQDFFSQMKKRMGEKALARRLRLQVDNAAHFYGGAGLEKFHLENTELMPAALHMILALFGLMRRGRSNCLEYRIEHQTPTFTGLPKAFDGLRVLHLSDMHIDAVPDGGARLLEIVQGLGFDLCLLTGDFRFLTHEKFSPVLTAMARITPALDCELGIYAILGNHDFIEMSPGLEALGIQMLLNEGKTLKLGKESLFLAGVDDPHFYGADDFSRALENRRGNEFTLLMCHSPERYAEAAARNVDYYLCGHTHGGQVCLPGGIPVITNAACPRRFVCGEWDYNGMRGYTSRGSGASGLTVRFNCPPEITLHTLRCRAG